MSIENYREIGDYLRDCREGKGDDIAQVSKQLNIRVKYLQAIEEGKFEVLPGTIYTEGYLKNYAEYLQLDSGDVLNKYKYGTANDDEQQDDEFALPEHGGDKFSPNPKMLFGSAAAIVLLYAIWYQVENYVPAKEEVVATAEIGEALSEDELTILGVMTGRVGVEEVENQEALIGMDADSQYSLSVGKSDSNQVQDLTIIKEAEKAKANKPKEVKGLGWKTAAPKLAPAAE